jgi:DNA-binding transcriptional MerR regulator
MADGMTVNELADVVGMTPRNIRAYQSRGLLASPRIEGRTARYASSHVARLQLIASLQREGFTLAAVKRLLDSPDSYSRIVADRRRRFREASSDIPDGVAVRRERVAEFGPDLPDRMLSLGLAWHEGDDLHVHTLFVGVTRTLDSLGLAPKDQTVLLLDAAEHGARVGVALRKTIDRALGASADDPDGADDVARVATQLHAAAFEVALAHAARVPVVDGAGN